MQRIDNTTRVCVYYYCILYSIKIMSDVSLMVRSSAADLRLRARLRSPGASPHHRPLPHPPVSRPLPRSPAARNCIPAIPHHKFASACLHQRLSRICISEQLNPVMRNVHIPVPQMDRRTSFSNLRLPPTIAKKSPAPPPPLQHSPWHGPACWLSLIIRHNQGCAGLASSCSIFVSCGWRGKKEWPQVHPF